MWHRRDNDRRLVRFARRMRGEATEAERRLWVVLRKHRLAGFRFRRQYPVGGFIVDFVCLGVKLIVEADGGQHREPEATEYDRARAAKLAKVGFEVLRFSDREVLTETDVVANEIYKRLVEMAEGKARRAGVDEAPTLTLRRPEYRPPP